MDLSRRRFLGMLGLAPVIPIVAPTKTYGFFGNIFRARPKLMYYVTGFNFDHQHVSMDLPLVFDERPSLDKLLTYYRPAAIGIPGAIKKYSIQWHEFDDNAGSIIHDSLTTLIGQI